MRSSVGWSLERRRTHVHCSSLEPILALSLLLRPHFLLRGEARGQMKTTLYEIHITHYQICLLPDHSRNHLGTADS